MMDNVRKILEFLASLKRDNTGDAWTKGPEIHDGLGRTDITPVDINDAINLARNRGWVKWMRWGDTLPYRFGQVTITSEGRFWLEDK